MRTVSQSAAAQVKQVLDQKARRDHRSSARSSADLAAPAGHNRVESRLSERFHTPRPACQCSRRVRSPVRSAKEQKADHVPTATSGAVRFPVAHESAAVGALRARPWMKALRDRPPLIASADLDQVRRSRATAGACKPQPGQNLATSGIAELQFTQVFEAIGARGSFPSTLSRKSRTDRPSVPPRSPTLPGPKTISAIPKMTMRCHGSSAPIGRV